MLHRKAGFSFLSPPRHCQIVHRRQARCASARGHIGWLTSVTAWRPHSSPKSPPPMHFRDSARVADGLSQRLVQACCCLPVCSHVHSHYPILGHSLPCACSHGLQTETTTIKHTGPVGRKDPWFRKDPWRAATCWSVRHLWCDVTYRGMLRLS